MNTFARFLLRHRFAVGFALIVVIMIGFAVNSRGGSSEDVAAARALATPAGVVAAFSERGFELSQGMPDDLGEPPAELTKATVLRNFAADGSDSAALLDSVGFLTIWIFDSKEEARAGLGVMDLQELRIYTRANVIAAYRAGIDDRSAGIETLLEPFLLESGSGGD
ncbi:hypothetical protein [Miltoncostaea oceani]|uniref:hypothetical protein n=1 Tax=Miltoncostaea oceani TaxID=2843216 RepID=UPI001C3E0E7C|nr:hypothetical protein [Miltoncostaea oceani]